MFIFCWMIPKKFSIWKRSDMTLLDIFQAALNQASHNSGTKVVLIIDSLDQLESASRTHLDWLPRKVPNNISLLISVIAGKGSAALGPNTSFHIQSSVAIRKMLEFWQKNLKN